MSYPVRSSSLLSNTSLLWSMRGISRLKPLLSHFFREITILAVVRLLGGVRTSTGASHAWLTPCPGRRHPFRTHQPLWHFQKKNNSPQVLSALCDTQELPLSGSFHPVSCTTAGGRCNKEESSAPLKERVNGGECALLCIRGQYEWNVWVIKSLGGLVLFGSCHNGVFDSWENSAFVGPCQWHYTLLWMLRIAGILHHAFFCAQGLSRIPSSFSLALLFVRLYIVSPATVEAEGLAENASSCWWPHSHINSTVKHWLMCRHSTSQILMSSELKTY